MIGNRILFDLYNYSDEDTAFNQLLEFLNFKDKVFINSLNKEAVELNRANKDEIVFLTKVSALIDFYMQLHKLKIPDWIRDKRLNFDKPFYYSKRIEDIDKLKLIISNPAPFRIRNVYFDLESIKRV